MCILGNGQLQAVQAGGSGLYLGVASTLEGTRSSLSDGGWSYSQGQKEGRKGSRISRSNLSVEDIYIYSEYSSTHNEGNSHRMS